MKTTISDPIAEQALLWVHANGTQRLVTARLGRPYPAEEGLWRCPVALVGVDGPYVDAAGDGAMQALTLAVRLLHTRLAHLIEDGERLCYVDNPELAWDRTALDAVFGR